MSVEAVALTQLIRSIEDAVSNRLGGPIFKAVEQAKYWVHPLQAHMDAAYKIWEDNSTWSRLQFLAYLKDLPNRWLLRCIVLGNMNFHVEQEGGFLLWKNVIKPGPLDFEVLGETCSLVKTPVGVSVISFISSVELLFNDFDQDEDGIVQPEAFKHLMGLNSEAYRNVRYQFLIEVEQLIRQDVPAFGLQSDL